MDTITKKNQIANIAITNVSQLISEYNENTGSTPEIFDEILSIMTKADEEIRSLDNK